MEIKVITGPEEWGAAIRLQTARAMYYEFPEEGSMIQRYSIRGGLKEQNDEGNYVHYAAHAAALKEKDMEIKRLKGLLSKIFNLCNGLGDVGGVAARIAQKGLLSIKEKL